MTTAWEVTAPGGDVPPLLERPVDAEVVVIGQGAAGLTAAVLLAEAGVDVVAVDAGHPGSGASGRNGGFLLAGLAEPHHEVRARLGRERASELHRRTAAALDATAQAHPGVRRVGSLRVSRSEAEDADVDAQYAAMREDGLPVERYEGPEGRGLLFPHDAAFHPLRRARELAARASAAGARLLYAAPVRAVDARGVVTTTGAVRASRGVLVAVDGGLGRLVPALQGRVRAFRLQMVGTAPAPDVVVPRPVYARSGLDYWQQLPDGRVVLGGGRDVGGEAERVRDGRWEAPTSEPVQAHLERLLRTDVGTAAPVEQRWSGVVGFTHDHLPVLAEPEPGLLAVGGYSGTGNLVGPLCAGWAVDRLLGRRNDLAALLTP